MCATPLSRALLVPGGQAPHRAEEAAVVPAEAIRRFVAVVACTSAAAGAVVGCGFTKKNNENVGDGANISMAVHASTRGFSSPHSQGVKP